MTYIKTGIMTRIMAAGAAFLRGGGVFTSPRGVAGFRQIPSK